MLSAYPACFLKEKSGYSVLFPDLKDLATCGGTLDEAPAMAADCLNGYLYACQNDREAIPTPSAIEKINPNAAAKALETAFTEAFVNIVTVDAAKYAKAHFENSVERHSRRLPGCIKPI